MKRVISFLCIIYCVSVCQLSAQTLIATDTFTSTINLDLNKNVYLKSVPVDLLKGYCKGYWNAYYPQREYNQCLFDDFLEHFNISQLNLNSTSSFCLSDYCNDAYFLELYNHFTRKIKFKEIVYYDSKHSVIKREVLWVQLYYSMEDYSGWKHYNGPIFWLSEIKQSDFPLLVHNTLVRSAAWSLEKEFNFPSFIINEQRLNDQEIKIKKYDQTEEH